MSQGWLPAPSCWLNHEWNGGATLMAYPAEPAAVTRMGERMHDRLYGMTTSRSPRTPYLAVWRDAAKNTAQDRKLGWPSRILLAAGFGTAPWEPPPNLIEEATLRQQRDEGNLRLVWDWQDDGYSLVEFGLELQRGGDRRFRSAHRGAAIGLLDLTIEPLVRPADGVPIAFRVAGQIRESRNPGDPPRGEAIRFAAMGTALPIPPWMIY